MSAPTLISTSRHRIVVGLGATGLSVARYLRGRGELFTVLDTREQAPGLEQLRREMPDVPVLAGHWDQELLNSADELIVSPGIAPEEAWLQQAVAAGASLRGDIDLFVEAAGAPVIGITGSNAKSTVTAMVGAMAAASGRRVAVGGNLGVPALDLLDERNELYVLELSSFQLERAGSLGLQVATVLNVTADHLDRHGSMPRYHQAKHRIFAGCGTVVYHADDPLTIPPLAGGREHISWRLREPELNGFGLRRDDGELMLAEGFRSLMAVGELPLPGRHNVANALAALAIGRAAGLPDEGMLAGLRAFTGLPHRCERIADFAGVRWINDSKATNVGAALAAIEGLGSEFRIILIAGGRDKGSDFSALRAAVARHCDHLLLIGEAAPAMREALHDACATQVVETLDAAVVQAAALAGEGQLVLLSPACASFDQFASFEARGDAFRRLVHGELGL